MHLRMLPGISTDISLPLLLEHYQLKKNNYQRNQEEEYRDAVDAVHVFHPLRMRCIWIPFFNEKVFGYLSENSHS